MKRLNHQKTLEFWIKNGKMKRHLNRHGDPEGLSIGLYDDFPPWINRYYAFFQNLVVNRFLKQIEFSGDGHVLEIGCGSARWCRKILDRPHKSITGSDISFHLLQNSMRFYEKKISFLNTPASILPIKNNILDLVYSITVIHHLPFHVQEVALDEIHRVLKHGRSFFIIESTEIDACSDHLYARNFDNWIKLLENHNFKIIDAVGQEYIDFRKIIRPVRRGIKPLAVRVMGKGERDEIFGIENPEPFNGGFQSLKLFQRLFHLLFAPLVLAAYPLELALYATNKARKGHYACLLSVKK
jgi:ubiquinone/menaquinone biosynthesis C-methylase UbiE